MQEKKTSLPSFGIELEFFIVDKFGYPILNTNDIVRKKCLEIDNSLSVCNELGSFQIEINPGPWDLSSEGFEEGISELKRQVKILKEAANRLGYLISESVMPERVSQEMIYSGDYFTKGDRYLSSAKYFSDSLIKIDLDDDKLLFPGETIVGFLNEIHIHVQLSNDKDTLRYFNYLNNNWQKIIDPYIEDIYVNGKNIGADNTTVNLFTKANGEWNIDKSVYRIGSFPGEIKSFDHYNSILKSFKKIPYINIKNKFLDLESTVYFWTRLRGKPGNLRVEFRPMEMGDDWIERVYYLYKISKDFSNLD